MVKPKNIYDSAFSKNFLILCLLISVFIFIPIKKLHALSHDWVGVPKSKYGEQLWDKKNITRNKDGSVRVLSKFIPKNKNEITEDIFYTMDINCFEKSFRDVNVATDKINEFVNNNANWKDPNGDQLILGVIGQVCNFERGKN